MNKSPEQPESTLSISYVSEVAVRSTTRTSNSVGRSRQILNDRVCIGCYITSCNILQIERCSSAADAAASKSYSFLKLLDGSMTSCPPGMNQGFPTIDVLYVVCSFVWKKQALLSWTYRCVGDILLHNNKRHTLEDTD